MDADTLKFIDEFQSTPSTRRETLQGCICQDTICISIHSLHTEGDKVLLIEFVSLKHFNPLPPHGGRQSGSRRGGNFIRISIHSLHTEGDKERKRFSRENFISIHSLHTEGDSSARYMRYRQSAFQSTPSTRRETRGNYIFFHEFPFQSTPSTRRETSQGCYSAAYAGISIHSLHTEGDFKHAPCAPPHANFNPLPPHGGRRN